MLFALISWWIILEKNWLRKAFLLPAKEAANAPDLISSEATVNAGPAAKKNKAEDTSSARSE
jgi:hypothetical protein